MMRQLKKIGVVGGTLVLLAAAMVSFLTPSSAFANPPASPRVCTGKEYFLTFPAWYRGLTTSDCKIKSPSDLAGPEDQKLSKFIWIIVLNVIDIILQSVAYIATGYILWGGYTYLTSVGRPEKIKRGKEMILNAVIGLVIAIIAVGVVGYAAGRISA